MQEGKGDMKSTDKFVIKSCLGITPYAKQLAAPGAFVADTWGRQQGFLSV